jgi:1-acyl-sn-glycerol-3-phosphate acyltransferase
VIKRIGWRVINTLQLLWLGFFSAWCFVVVMVLYAITWNPDCALSVARHLYGPVNVFLGFSSVVVDGKDNVPRDRPYVLMMNHQSMGDIMVAWMITPVPVRFIAKHMLRFVPVVGWTMMIFNMVSIDRGNAHDAARALKKAARVLKNGTSLCAFPEGTRTRDGRIGPFKRGVFLLAMKAGVPIVPVAMEGCATFVPRTGWNPRPVTIRVKIGTPVETSASAPGESAPSRDEVMRKVRDAIIDMNVQIGGAGGEKALVSADA